MLKKFIFIPAAAVFLALIVVFASPDSKNPDEVSKIENFSLKDYNNKEHSLADYKNSKAIVLMFIATECPISNAYNERMASIYEKYKGKEIAFLGINPNNTESVSEVKSHAKKNNLNFTILKDEKNVIADKLNATVTPEIYVVNSEFEVLYHGRIDDSRNKDNVTSRDLEKALDEILSGKKVTTQRTKAFGCTIKRI